METPTSTAEWMARISEGELTPAHKIAFAEWLRESPAHVREFFTMTFIQQDLRAAAISPAQIEAWTREATEIPPPPYILPLAPRSGERAWVRGLNPNFLKQAVAATVLLALSAVSVWSFWQHNRYITDFGEQRIVTLKDGSVVSLNTDSQLKVSFSKEKRSIELLKGEAFFRVSHDPGRPFEVSARDATVRALGTQFNVRIAPAVTLVSVVDGSVEVREGQKSADAGSMQRSAQRNAVRLVKGEEASVLRHSKLETNSVIAKATVPAAQRTSAWTRGRVEFDATPLGEVLQEFQRYREFRVEFESRRVRDLKLTGSFEAHDPKSALEYIDSLPNLQVITLSPESFLIKQTSSQSLPLPEKRD